MGLINKIVPAAELEDFVRQYAQPMANNAPLTMATAKAGIREALKDPPSANSKLIEEMVAALLQQRRLSRRCAGIFGKAPPEIFRPLTNLSQSLPGVTLTRAGGAGSTEVTRLMRIVEQWIVLSPLNREKLALDASGCYYRWRCWR